MKFCEMTANSAKCETRELNILFSFYVRNRISISFFLELNKYTFIDRNFLSINK